MHKLWDENGGTKNGNNFFLQNRFLSLKKLILISRDDLIYMKISLLQLEATKFHEHVKSNKKMTCCKQF